MEISSKRRTPLVWTALALQALLFTLALWTIFQLLTLAHHASYSTTIANYLLRSLVEAILLGVSFVGLWRSKRWGWVLAVLVDGFMCVMDLSVFITTPFLLTQYRRIFAYQIWDYATLVVLLNHSVRCHFGNQSALRRVSAAQVREPARETVLSNRRLRIVIFFVAAATVTCAVTAFSVALLLSRKQPVGGRVFLFLFLIAIGIGGLSALLFTAIMTFVVRKLNPALLSLWILIGGLLAPGMIFGLAILMGLFSHPGTHVSPILSLLMPLCGGASYLVQVWWLGFPIGMITAFTCYQMYPWSFTQT